MFTREELITKAPSFVDLPKSLIEVIFFDQDDFLSPASEQSIMICRGVKTNFDNAIHFWAVAMQSEQWEGREEYFLPYLGRAVCRVIDEKEFLTILNHCQSLKHPFVIAPKGKYIWGQEMADDDEWSDFSALAEFEHEYLSFHWQMTA